MSISKTLKDLIVEKDRKYRIDEGKSTVNGDGDAYLQELLKLSITHAIDQAKAEECPRCHKKTLVRISIQLRAGDEGEDTIQTCFNCQYSSRSETKSSRPKASPITYVSSI